MENVTKIEQAMLTGGLSPHDMADHRVTLSAEFSRACGELEEILAVRTSIWQAMRDNTKTDKAADKAYEGTEQGIKEMRLRMKIKRIEKLISALSSMLKVAEAESRNQF